jgi:hypothetical protein
MEREREGWRGKEKERWRGERRREGREREGYGEINNNKSVLNW